MEETLIPSVSAQQPRGQSDRLPLLLLATTLAAGISSSDTLRMPTDSLGSLLPDAP